ncbi:hypothetical protein [Jidongwangia harbinensis]|uniref:hypothetical protein n=1 Tax=Jidongwangia harbinensis TaxID=2878561 RepID=UPI001CD987E8|nr:hypothetical protein [Jidongwangia harbinensis]MCA2216257.1 hypothetical protein [Jidongwangia harbinensis]MCA2216992.1 hypothetical protein [Jidongwangia harbinensis]
MPIDTQLEGDPASIRASASWLTASLASAVGESVTDLFKVRDEAESGWRGDAGPAFSSKLDAGAREADRLRADAERAGRSLNSYADDLTTAQVGMQRARAIALEGGLALAGSTILDPGAGPTLPAALSAAATPEQAQVYHGQVTAYHEHQAKVTAYAQAEAQAKWARSIGDFAKDTLQNALDDLRKKPVIIAAGFVNEGVIGGLAARHVSQLKKQSDLLKAASEDAVNNYLKSRGGSPEAKALNLASWQKYLEADEFERRALRAGSKIEARIPVIGLAVTAVDIGYDIHTGKPVGKAVVSGVGGAMASMAAGAAVGTMIGGPVGTVVGAGAGIVIGMATSGALDAAYDRLPDGTQQAIDDGFKAIGEGVSDAGEAVGDTAKKVWNSIF